jgi:hypothetical protein
MVRAFGLLEVGKRTWNVCLEKAPYAGFINKTTLVKDELASHIPVLFSACEVRSL